MADSSPSSTQNQQDQQSQSDQSQQQQQPQWAGAERRNQSQFDQMFAAQISRDNGAELTQQAVAAYFDLAEQTVRTARRVGEVQTLHLLRQEIVKDVCSEIQRNPQWIAAALQTSMLSQQPQQR